MRFGTLLLMAVCLTTACQRGDARPRSMLYRSKSYTFLIEPEQAPPHAREPILYKVFIRDRDTRQPIENGEGQIYSNNAEMARTWDGFTYGPQLGTYFGKLNFVTSGTWAI